jgi:hypothetical protein
MANRKISRTKHKTAETMLVKGGNTWKEISETTGMSVRNVAYTAKNIRLEQQQIESDRELMKKADFKEIQSIMRDKLIEVIVSMKYDIERIKTVEKKLKILEYLTRICVNINTITDNKAIEVQTADDYFKQYLKKM